jgi:hypothetical protein
VGYCRGHSMCMSCPLDLISRPLQACALGVSCHRSSPGPGSCPQRVLIFCECSAGWSVCVQHRATACVLVVPLGMRRMARVCVLHRANACAVGLRSKAWECVATCVSCTTQFGGLVLEAALCVDLFCECYFFSAGYGCPPVP